MVREIWSFDKNKNLDQYVSKRSIEGGTVLVAFGELASCMNSSSSGMDSLGLGKWSYMEFQGTDNRCTVMLSGYITC